MSVLDRRYANFCISFKSALTVHTGEVQGIKVKWREIGWNALIEEFAPSGIGAELLEVEA